MSTPKPQYIRVLPGKSGEGYSITGVHARKEGDTAVYIATKNDLLGLPKHTLVAVYNAFTGKTLKKFDTVSDGINRTWAAVAAELGVSDEAPEPAASAVDAVPAPSTAAAPAPDSPAPDTTSQEHDVATKKGKKRATKKANGKKPAKGTKVKKQKEPKGPGVIDTVGTMIQRANGASQEEILERCRELFPGRKVESLRSTIRIQVTRYPKEHKLKLTTEKSEKRGRVYYASAK